MGVMGVAKVGLYTGSESPYGTFDQGGNVWEWNESISSANRFVRGGSFDNSPVALSSSNRISVSTSLGSDILGFRVAGTTAVLLPFMNPISFFILVAGLASAGWRGLRKGIV